MSEDYSGECLCGAVGFSAGAPSLWCAHCHCQMCRRAHGAGCVTWVGVAEDRFSLEDSGGKLVWYDSSADSQRGFCSACGSTLFFRSERWPGEVHVVLANFDGDIDRQPQAHVFWETHVEWLQPGDDLPRKTSTPG